MNQLTRANISRKESIMYCEGIFEMYGTSSQEIAAKAAKEAARQVHEEDSAILQETMSELERLKALLDLHHIVYKVMTTGSAGGLRKPLRGHFSVLPTGGA